MEDMPLNLEGEDLIQYLIAKDAPVEKKVLFYEQIHDRQPENDVLKFKLASSYGLLMEYEAAIILLNELHKKYLNDGIVDQLLKLYTGKLATMIKQGEDFLTDVYRNPGKASFIYSTIHGLDDFLLSKEFDRSEVELTEKWKAMKENKKKRDIFLRSWSIETGAVENLYDLSEATTKLFLEIGFSSDFVSHKDKICSTINAGIDGLLNKHKEIADFLLNNVGIDLTKKLITDLHEKFLHTVRFTEIRIGVVKSYCLIRKGKFKIVPNIVEEPDGQFYVYCPPKKVESEIDKLLELYGKYRMQGCSPLILSAWLHHKFIQIHPFQDGNGRVCRAISSLVLIEKSLPPVIILKKNRQDYFKALRVANDNNDLVPLIKCMLANYEETFQTINQL
eukprot:TRINITY_DN8162_c0_g1_i1.p1 TRINITY_DN8162_c0_g1~~TRINITY_DN8162_c0_g1_i1.p1  ORF type:complete len:416 (+),score=37.23 TRINITY_DN8162_c0_g1_i1:77-1249(+)